MAEQKWDDHIFKVKSDSEWQSRLRALQSWYREHVLQTEAGFDRYKKLRGNFLPTDAPRDLNFLNLEIANFVEEWLLSAKDTGALVGEDRLMRNMLSSMPLAFNLFVPLRNNLALASRVFNTITDGRVELVTGINFEYSPGRGDPRYTEDGTAFDVFVSFTGNNGGDGFIGIETKYHEDLSGDGADKKERYLQIANEMGCFNSSKLDSLPNPPLGQMWRNHLLAGILKSADKFQDGLFVLLHPAANIACINAAAKYQACLSNSKSFDVWQIEQIVKVILQSSPSEWIEAFSDRYLHYEKIGKGG